jgi:V/A-type H+-transporting ATPase subunit C
MTARASQTYLFTRATILSERLLTDESLEELVQHPLTQLGQIFELGQLLEENCNECNLNRAVERALINTLMHELSILLRPLSGPERNLLIHWIRKFELFNLKALIRGKLNELSYSEIQENLHDLPPLISLPHEKLLRTENIAELLRQLEQGQYSDIARQARRVYEEKNEIFSLDASIDQRYYAGLLKRARAIPSDEHDSLLNLVATLIDQQNLLWLLRYRFNYAFSPSETYYLLIPFGRHIKRVHLMQMVNLDSFSEVIEALPEALKQHLAEMTSIMDVDHAMTKFLRQQARNCLKFSSSSASRALAYLILRELDLKQVYAIIQGKVLKLDNELIAHATGLSRNFGSGSYV